VVECQSYSIFIKPIASFLIATHMDILSRIFGSPNRVKIMRLFLFNPDKVYGNDDVAHLTKTPIFEADIETRSLHHAGMLKRRLITKLVKSKFKRKTYLAKRKITGWVLNEKFPHLSPLQVLLVNTLLLKSGDIIKKISRAGSVKLIIISGVFIQSSDSRIDLLIVGDKFRKTAVQRVIKGMESEIGKELRYSLLTTDDFRYRLSVYDKLVRDVFDFPHKKIFDRLGIER
jgi:hypothetical protein